MKFQVGAAIVAAIVVGNCAAESAPIKTHRKPAQQIVQPGSVASPFDAARGNAALGGNNANSASGSNSANENANGRSGGGFGG